MSGGAISYARAAVLKDLEATAAAPVYSVMPPVLHPPALIVSEATPLITASDTIGGLTAAFTVLAIVEATPADREKELETLDALVDVVIFGLWQDYGLTVDGYRPISLGAGQNYLSTQIHISVDLSIKE